MDYAKKVLSITKNTRQTLEKKKTFNKKECQSAI